MDVGHNTLVFSTGKRLNLGYNPQTQEVGIQYNNADQITVVEKDNATLEVEFSDTVDADGKVTTRVSKLTYTIGEQTTGADVDMKKVENEN